MQLALPGILILLNKSKLKHNDLGVSKFLV